MREVTFIRRNQQRWKEFEQMLQHPETAEASQLASAYVQLMDDLAYAQAQFPTAESTSYLNSLAGQVHGAVAVNKRLRWDRVRTLFFDEIPTAFIEIRPHLLIATVVFLACVAIGYVSGVQNEGFVRSVLGDQYVDMTISNIQSGQPLDVYNQENPLLMFMYIGLNNITILLKTVGLGLFPVVGAAYLLIPNGVMVGAFMGLFAQYGQLATANLGIWVHGTLEISAIVVGCASAIRVTEAVLHPHTYPRTEAFVRGVRTAVLVTVGMVPLLVVAAFLEGFVTRLYATSPILNLSIITASLTFVIWYVIVWPQILIKRKQNAG